MKTDEEKMQMALDALALVACELVCGRWKENECALPPRGEGCVEIAHFKNEVMALKWPNGNPVVAILDEEQDEVVYRLVKGKSYYKGGVSTTTYEIAERWCLTLKERKE